MNSKNSLIIFFVAIVFLAAAIWGFAHGAKTIDVDLTKGIAWMDGSGLVAVLSIFLFFKLKK
jgi:hypothetical protein